MLGYALRANPTYNVHEVGHRNAQGISSYPTAVITSRLSRFIIAPADAMSGALIRPLPKIIALGGVATGSMNAQLAALCGEMGVGYVDVMAALGQSADWHAAMAAGDGVHPTAEGYAIIARLIGASAAWRSLIGGN